MSDSGSRTARKHGCPGSSSERAEAYRTSCHCMRQKRTGAAPVAAFCGRLPLRWPEHRLTTPPQQLWIIAR